MRFKKKYLSIFALLLPLLITIGFASWVIVYTIEFSTQYINQPTGALFNQKEEVTYNGDVQLPTSKSDLNTILGDNGKIDYKYRLEKDKNPHVKVDLTNDNLNDDGPIDAGTYDVIIRIKDSVNNAYDGTCQVKLTIKKQKIKLYHKELEMQNVFEFNYSELLGSGCTDTETGKITPSSQLSYIDNVIRNYFLNDAPLEFQDENGNKVTSLNYNSYLPITSINNGYYYAGEKVEGMLEMPNNLIAGSTYVGEINLKEDYKNNYEFIDLETKSGKVAGNKIYIKYKTAKVGASDTLYTVEDAIAKANESSGTVHFLGDTSSSYIVTCFTNIPLSEGNPYGSLSTTLYSGNTILVPFEASLNYNSTIDAAADQNFVHSADTVYSVLVVPTNVKLNINGSLIVAAKLGYDQPDISFVLDRGVIMNYGTININNNGVFKSYGYTKGTGTVNLEKGSRATDVIKGLDFPGGATSYNIYGDTFPMNGWSLHNISCKMYIKNGSRLYGHVYLNPSVVTNNEYLIIGTTATSDNNCIFRSNSDNAEYILKYATNAKTKGLENYDYNGLTDITGCNQIVGQRTVFQVKGDYTDSNFQITITADIGFTATINLKTSTDISLPLSFSDIIVETGSTLMLQSSDYLLFPGSKILVQNGATVTINDNVDISMPKYSIIEENSIVGGEYSFTTYCIDKMAPELIVNGQLIIYGNIGGEIKSENPGAIINLSSTNSATSSQFKSLYNAVGSLSGAFGSKDDKRYSAKVEETTGNINFDPNGKFTNGNYYIYSNQNTWTISENIKEFEIYFMDGTEEIYKMSTAVGENELLTFPVYEPNKLYYNFNKWLDAEGNELKDKTFEGTVGSITKIYAYADWTSKEYSLYYLYYKEKEDGTIEIIELDDPSLIPVTLTPVGSTQTFYYSKLLEQDILIDGSASYKDMTFKSWYIGDKILESKILNNNKITATAFKSLVTENYEYNDSELVVPISCLFVEQVKYSINIVHNIEGESEIGSETGLGLYDSFELINYSIQYPEDAPNLKIHFVNWSIENKIAITIDLNNNKLSLTVEELLDIINEYNETNQNDPIDTSNGSIKISGVIHNKALFKYEERNYANTSNVITECYVCPGKTVYFDKEYTSSTEEFKSELYYIEYGIEKGTNSIVDNSIKIDVNDVGEDNGIIIVFKYSKKITLKVTASNYQSYTIKADKYLNSDNTLLFNLEQSNVNDIITIEGAKITVSATGNRAGFLNTTKITVSICGNSTSNSASFYGTPKIENFSATVTENGTISIS